MMPYWMNKMAKALEIQPLFSPVDRYSQSLLHNVRSSTGEVEFDKVVSLTGVYLANVVAVDAIDSGYEKAGFHVVCCFMHRHQNSWKGKTYTFFFFFKCLFHFYIYFYIFLKCACWWTEKTWDSWDPRWRHSQTHRFVIKDLWSFLWRFQHQHTNPRIHTGIGSNEWISSQLTSCRWIQAKQALTESVEQDASEGSSDARLKKARILVYSELLYKTVYWFNHNQF